MDIIKLTAKTLANYVQGTIVNIISSYSTPDDIYEVIKLARAHIEIYPKKPLNITNMGFGYSYARANNLDGAQTDIVVSALVGDFATVIAKAQLILRDKFGIKQFELKK